MRLPQTKQNVTYRPLGRLIGSSSIYFEIVLVFGPKTGSRRAGRGLKRLLEAVRFILAEFEPKPSHGDLIGGQTEVLGRMACVGI